MLNLFFKGENNERAKGLPLVEDVELELLSTNISDTKITRDLIKKIEQGEYLDNNSFIDRFGFKLYINNMSTGCKAALIVSANPNKLIDLRECGWNARDEIIKNCKEGNILIKHSDITFALTAEEENSIDVRLDDYRFTNINSLNRYIEAREFDEETGKYILDEETLYKGMEEIV